MTQASNPVWNIKAGATAGGFTVGHAAKRNGNPVAGLIVGVREENGVAYVLLRYLTPQPVDVPEGATATDFEVRAGGISCTWRMTATIEPHKRPGRQTIHPFGSAPGVVPKGYGLLREVLMEEAQILDQYNGKPVVLVQSAPPSQDSTKVRVGIFAWQPRFSRWRHGGYYVGNVSHLNGGLGCISNNYPDKKWRIVCDTRRGHRLNEPGDFTFPSRDAAARAELEWTTALKTLVAAGELGAGLDLKSL